METIEDNSGTNEVILQLIKHILKMTKEERLDLLQQMDNLPVRDLSLGEREWVRRPYDQTITFSTQDRQYTAACKDISNGGIFIQTDEIFQLGQMVSLDIPFSSGRESITIPAEIVRVNPEGIGLRFLKKENITYV